MDRTNASVEHGSGAGELSANGGRREPGRELAILPAEIARRVHSEQVVSTVVDVVRELIENALDASASRIKLFVVHSGLMSISVSDNGIGIPQNSLGLLFKPHYTSKLVSIDQLPHTTTFGFRGEALYAIAVLADEVEVATMCEGESVGRKIVVGTRGVLKSSAPTPLPASGTTITVRRMFLPHPVRRAHALQHPPTRFRDALQSLVAGYAVECPHVGWVVKGTDAPPPAPAGSTGKKKAGPDAGKGKEWSFSLPATASLVQSARGAFPFLSVGENGGWVIVETERTLPPEDDGDDAPPLAIRVRAIVPKPGQMLPPHPSPPPPIHLNRRTCVSAPPHLSSAVESALARWNDTIPNAPSSAGIKPKKVFSWWSISLSGGNGVDANLSPDKRHILLAAEDDERAAGVVREVVDELYGGYEAKSDEVDTQGTRRNAPPTNTPRARSPPPPLSPARTPLTPLVRNTADPSHSPPRTVVASHRNPSVRPAVFSPAKSGAQTNPRGSPAHETIESSGRVDVRARPTTPRTPPLHTGRTPMFTPPLASKTPMGIVGPDHLRAGATLGTPSKILPPGSFGSTPGSTVTSGDPVSSPAVPLVMDSLRPSKPAMMGWGDVDLAEWSRGRVKVICGSQGVEATGAKTIVSGPARLSPGHPVGMSAQTTDRSPVDVDSLGTPRATPRLFNRVATQTLDFAPVDVDSLVFPRDVPSRHIQSVDVDAIPSPPVSAPQSTSHRIPRSRPSSGHGDRSKQHTIPLPHQTFSAATSSNRSSIAPSPLKRPPGQTLLDEFLPPAPKRPKPPPSPRGQARFVNTTLPQSRAWASGVPKDLNEWRARVRRWRTRPRPLGGPVEGDVGAVGCVGDDRTWVIAGRVEGDLVVGAVDGLALTGGRPGEVGKGDVEEWARRNAEGEPGGLVILWRGTHGVEGEEKAFSQQSATGFEEED